MIADVRRAARRRSCAQRTFFTPRCRCNTWSTTLPSSCHLAWWLQPLPAGCAPAWLPCGGCFRVPGSSRRRQQAQTADDSAHVSYGDPLSGRCLIHYIATPSGRRLCSALRPSVRYSLLSSMPSSFTGCARAWQQGDCCQGTGSSANRIRCSWRQTRWTAFSTSAMSAGDDAHSHSLVSTSKTILLKRGRVCVNLDWAAGF